MAYSYVRSYVASFFFFHWFTSIFYSLPGVATSKYKSQLFELCFSRGWYRSGRGRYRLTFYSFFTRSILSCKYP